MRGLIMHVTVYVAGCAVAIFVWLMTAGSWDELDHYARNPSEAFTVDFWPIVVIVVWGAALLVHAVAVLSRAASPRHRARQAHRRQRERARLAEADAGSGPPARRHVSVMFTDIAGSTPLAQALGDDAWLELLADHRALVRRHLANHGGSEVGTQGDGFLVCFDRADDAVGCAIDLQRDLERRRTAEPSVPKLRVGIHAGEALADDDDLIGRVVNLAARVVGVADPDQVLITEPVADHLQHPVALHDCGLHELKGIAGPRHLLAVTWTQPADAP